MIVTHYITSKLVRMLTRAEALLGKNQKPNLLQYNPQNAVFMFPELKFISKSYPIYNQKVNFLLTRTSAASCCIVVDSNGTRMSVI